MTAFVQCGAAGVVAALVAWQLGALLTTLEAESRRVEATAGAMAFAFAVAVGLCAASLPPPAAYTARVIVPAGALVLIAGLWRDLDRGFRYLAGLALIGAAALVVAGGGIQIDQVKIPLLSGASPFWKLGAAGPPLTVAFIVGVAVVVRATDPMPGLTAGLGFLSALTFMLVALTRGRDSLAAVSDLSAPLAAVIAGACCGLVTPGLGPRALSLGRGGAGLLGFLLGVLAVIGTLKHTAFLVLGLPLLALAVPLLNLLYMQRQWVQAGQQDPADLVDMLQRRGFTHRRTVGVLLGLQAYCCLVALALVVLITLPVILKALLLATLLPAACAAFFLISRIAARVAAVGAEAGAPANTRLTSPASWR